MKTYENLYPGYIAKRTAYFESEREMKWKDTRWQTQKQVLLAHGTFSTFQVMQVLPAMERSSIALNFT